MNNFIRRFSRSSFSIFARPSLVVFPSNCLRFSGVTAVNKNISVQNHNIKTSINLYCSSSSHKCWNCGKQYEITENFCSSCKIIQPLSKNASYFHILGLPNEFAISTSNLAKKFRNLQGLYHPDRYAQKTEKEREYSSLHSSYVNKAYRTLLHPVSRAEYMLTLLGRPLEEEQMSLDQEFLHRIMEINEKLSELTDKEDIAGLGQENRDQRDLLLKEADDAFKANNIDAAREAVAKLKYYDNIYNKVVEYERSHGIVY